MKLARALLQTVVLLSLATAAYSSRILTISAARRLESETLLPTSAGDDVTDEDFFARLPAGAWSIHVGTNRSRARYRLTETAEVW